MEEVLSRHEQLQDTGFVFNIDEPNFLHLHGLEARSVSPYGLFNCILHNLADLGRPKLIKNELSSIFEGEAVTPIPFLNQDNLAKRIFDAFIECMYD
jgi:hypothetical protein